MSFMSIKIISSSSSMLMSKHYPELNSRLPDNVSSKLLSARQQIWNRILSTSVLLPQIHSYTYTHFFSLSLHDGFPVRVEQMSWTRRHSNTQGERSVLTVDDFFSDVGYILTKKLSLNVFMCSCAALYLQWSPAMDIIDFSNHRTNALI